RRRVARSPRGRRGWIGSPRVRPRRPALRLTPLGGATAAPRPWRPRRAAAATEVVHRSEEHTSELQSREKLVCRLLLEKKIYFQRRFTILNLLKNNKLASFLSYFTSIH